MKRRSVLALLAALLFLPLPAFALDASDAEKVVVLVETLEPDRGKIAYDADEADQWFEDDSAGAGLIAKAGFAQESWKAAFDAVMQGYIALVPQAEIDAKFAVVKARLDTASSLTADQKAVVQGMYDEQLTTIRTWRQMGQAYMDVVRPLAPRLKPLIVPDSD